LANADVVLIPIHENNIHWCLVVVDIVSHRIRYLDRCGPAAQLVTLPNTDGLRAGNAFVKLLQSTHTMLDLITLDMTVSVTW
jgi:Ulp1 protease family, C-terminal catalytic domain